jgi:GNAT superfamily N-acetyltransferase
MQGSAIVRAGPQDVAELAPLFDAYRFFFAGREELYESRLFLEERLARNESVVFVVRGAHGMDGFVQLYPLWSSWHCRRIWFLSDLYVREASRKRGLGFRLVQRTVDFARETDAASIMVELPHREPHLTGFYAKLGFHRDPLFDLARFTLDASG